MVLRHVRTNIQKFKTKLSLAAVTASALVVGSAAAVGAWGGPSQTTVYDNIPNPIPGNVASLGYEATSTTEFGGQIELDGSARKDPKVTVLMSSWACKSGSWSAKTCITNPGSTFTHPVTLNVYNVNDDDSPGSVIKTVTQTFTMPYRPTADDGTYCSGANAGKWWDGSYCNNGKAFTISFNLSGVTLPDNVILGVAYNTSDYGVQPLGHATACYGTPQGCPYDSLNVGTNPAPTVGEAVTNDDAYLNSSWDGAYCDGSLGTGTFRLDAGCWTGYVPAFQVDASSGKGNYPKHHHKPHHFYGDKKHHNNYGGYKGFYSFWNR